jgi:ribonuclease-3
LPRYRVTEVLGPDHDKLYRVEVYVEGMLMGAGEGKNKKSAEQDAARQALDNFDPASLNARMDQGDSEGPGIRP